MRDYHLTGYDLQRAAFDEMERRKPYRGMDERDQLSIESPHRDIHCTLSRITELAVTQGLSVRPIDRDDVVREVEAYHKLACLPRPRIVFVPNPWQCLADASRHQSEDWIGSDLFDLNIWKSNPPKMSPKGGVEDMINAPVLWALRTVKSRFRHAKYNSMEQGMDWVERFVLGHARFRNFASAVYSDLTPFAYITQGQNRTGRVSGGQLDVATTVQIALLAHYPNPDIANLIVGIMPLLRLSHSCGAYIPSQNGVVYISERPTAIRFEGSDLHCENAPAIDYKGRPIWAWKNVIVSEQIIMQPETLTLPQIDRMPNLETRRVMVERWGWERYLEESKAERLSESYNERDGQTEVLYASRLGGRRFVVVDPSTGRKYVLGVPDSVSTCEEAQLWISHGLDRFAVHRS